MRLEEFYSFLAMFDINLAEEYEKAMKEVDEEDDRFRQTDGDTQSQR